MKSKKIDFRITEQDYNEVLKKAEKAGISANAWAREVVLKAIVPISEPTSETGTNRSNNITPLSHMERDKRLFVSEKTIAACFQQKAQYIVISPLRYTTFSIRVCTRS